MALPMRLACRLRPSRQALALLGMEDVWVNVAAVITRTWPYFRVQDIPSGFNGVDRKAVASLVQGLSITRGLLVGASEQAPGR